MFCLDETQSELQGNKLMYSLLSFMVSDLNLFYGRVTESVRDGLFSGWFGDIIPDISKSRLTRWDYLMVLMI